MYGILKIQIKGERRMSMLNFIRPHTQTALAAAPIAIVAVLLFVWLFNSIQMGKFKSIKPIANPKHAVFIIFAFIIMSVVLISLIMFR